MPYTKTLDRYRGVAAPESWTAVDGMWVHLRGRAALFTTLWLAYVLSSLLTRLLLVAVSLDAGLVTWGMLPRLFAMGMLLDAVTGMYLCAPFALYLWLVPRRVVDSALGRQAIFAGFALSIAACACLAAAEYFFFDSFHARFNDKAVEPLRHPADALRRILDTYPVCRVALTAAWAGLMSTFLLRERIAGAFGDDRSTLGQRSVGMVALTALIALSLAGISLDTAQGAKTRRVSGELAENGVYAFFSAIRHPLSTARSHKE